MMMRMRRYLSILTLLVFGGCATLPSGPSVNVLPGPGKAFEQFQAEDAFCRQWAGQQIGQSPQDIMNQNAAAGAVVGTATGAALGALIGAATGHAGTGAAIGAGSGFLFGTAAGANAGQVYGREAQRRYNIAYVQCMYAKGNQIPGAQRIRRVRRIAPPPPPPESMGTVPPDYVPSNQPPPPPAMQ
jgi:outer membrane lipoprotein SlyB